MSTPPVIREIDVRRQHRMSLRETWTLCIRGVKHRLFRSALTLAVVVLAVAFFMFLLCDSMYQRAVGKGVDAEIASSRAAQIQLTRLLTPATATSAMRHLAAAEKAGDEAALAEAVSVTGLPREEIGALAELAAQERLYTDWFAKMPVGRRLILVKRDLGRDALRHVLDDSDAFFRQLSIMVDLRVPGPKKADGLREFLAAFPDYVARMDAFLDRWNAKVAEAGRLTAARLAAAGNPPETRWIPGAPAEETEAWRASVAALGFSFTPEDLATMRSQLRDANDEADLSDRLSDVAFRDAWKVKFRESTDTTAEEKMGRLGDRRARELLADAFPAERLDELAANHAAKNRLSQLERALAASLGDDSALLGLSGRQLFLLAISFLVCMVGIANAMLMSITERYREIATMKCLGATDSYILSQFMMEAALQGFFGGLVGVVLGFAISTVRSALAFGGHLWAYFPAGDVALCALFSLAAGVLLAALASIQPSWSASRMAPMEAMRVE